MPLSGNAVKCADALSRLSGDVYATVATNDERQVIVSRNSQ